MLGPPAVLITTLLTLPVGQVPRAPAAPAGAGEAAARDEAATATLVFGGDVLPHRSVVGSFRAYGTGSLLGPIAPVFQAADLALVNVDSPASPSSPCPAPDVRFNLDPPMVSALAATGIDGVVVANNHAHDYGARGLSETIVSLRSAGIQPVGATHAEGDPYAPVTFPVAGRALCVFGFSRVINWPMDGDPASCPRIALARQYHPAEIAQALAAVRAHRARCDGVLVSVHAGTEYFSAPEPPQRAFARDLAEAGADVVIGHHPHTAQPVEVVETRRGARVPVFYSLGNLVSGQGSLAERGINPFATPRWQRPLDARVREGLVAVVRFRAERESGRLRVARYGVVPVWTINTTDLAARQQTRAPVRISASLMPLPRPTDATSLLARRYRFLLGLVGRQHFLRRADLPGALAADALSIAAREEAARARPPAGARGDALNAEETPE